MKFKMTATTMARAFVSLVMVCSSLACGRRTDTPQTSAPQSPPTPPKETVTAKVFEPVYRAAKTVQGATESGVSYVKFGELLQGLSTEISIAKDQNLNATDKKLLALYEEAMGHYQASAALWKLKIDASDDLWKGEIPVKIKGSINPGVKPLIDLYELPVVDRKMAYTNTPYGAIPGDSPQRVWVKATATLQKATDLYYGR